MTRSTSSTVPETPIDQMVDSAIQPTNAATNPRYTVSARESSIPCRRTAATAATKANASAAQPHEVEKYPPWAAVVPAIAAVTATATTPTPNSSSPSRRPRPVDSVDTGASSAATQLHVARGHSGEGRGTSGGMSPRTQEGRQTALLHDPSAPAGVRKSDGRPCVRWTLETVSLSSLPFLITVFCVEILTAHLCPS